MFYLLASALTTALLFAWLRERVLYVLFLWAYIQNFTLAWMYTAGYASRDACQAMIVSKEFLLLWMFIYFSPRLKVFGEWPAPLRILAVFTGWCVVRFAIAFVFQHQTATENLLNLRLVCFPFQVLSVAIGVAQTQPEFARLLVRRMSYGVAVLAGVGILLWLPINGGLWSNYVDYAKYSFEVKGETHGVNEDDPGAAVEAANAGVVGNGMARGEFAFLSPFRAIGMVGDAVGFGHFAAFGVLTFLFCAPRNWKTRLILIIAGGALFVSFTRSAWMFVLGVWLFVLVHRRRYSLLLVLSVIPLLAIALWAPMRDWFLSSIGSSSDPDIHLRGINWFFQEGLWDIKYLFGHSMDWSEPIPEGGYGMLLIRFGLPAVVTIAWFFLALYRTLRNSQYRDMPFFLIASAMPLVLLVTMNFSAYPFSFIPYLLPWFAVGICLAFAINESQFNKKGIS